MGVDSGKMISNISVGSQSDNYRHAGSIHEQVGSFIKWNIYKDNEERYEKIAKVYPSLLKDKNEERNIILHKTKTEIYSLGLSL